MLAASSPRLLSHRPAADNAYIEVVAGNGGKPGSLSRVWLPVGPDARDSPAVEAGLAYSNP
jgi:hypothetical protein